MNTDVWIVVADSARARIFCADPTLEEWDMVQTLHHPESRKKEHELVSDTHASHARRGARSNPAGPGTHLDHELEIFSKEVAQTLENARTQGAYRSLILVAPPQFLGILRNDLPKGTADVVETTLSKDYSRMPGEQIRERIASELAERPLLV